MSPSLREGREASLRELTRGGLMRVATSYLAIDPPRRERQQNPIVSTQWRWQRTFADSVAHSFKVNRLT